MCNLETERKFHQLAEDGELAFELTLNVTSGALVTLRALNTEAGLAWTYELGTAATALEDSGADSAMPGGRGALQ